MCSFDFLICIVCAFVALHVFSNVRCYKRDGTLKRDTMDCVRFRLTFPNNWRISRRMWNTLTLGMWNFFQVTTSRATSGAGRNDRNTSGQRENKFNTSYRDISVVVAESNSVVKPKCEQYTSLNKMWNNFSSVDGTYIFYCYIKQCRYRERHRLHSERH